MRRLIALALLAGALLAGCGGDDVSLEDAKADVVIACREGSTDELDQKLCRCIADEATTHDEYDTVEELQTLIEQQSSAQAAPAALAGVIQSCARRLTDR